MSTLSALTYLHCVLRHICPYVQRFYYTTHMSKLFFSKAFSAFKVSICFLRAVISAESGGFLEKNKYKMSDTRYVLVLIMISPGYRNYRLILLRIRTVIEQLTVSIETSDSLVDLW